MSEAVTVGFVDGREFTTTTDWPEGRADDIVGIDADGNPVARTDHGDLIGLTWCHGATFTGTIGGIGCRACYELDCGGSDMPVSPVTPRVPIQHPT